MTQEQELIERKPVECTPENVERCIQGLTNWVEHYNAQEQWSGRMPMLLVSDAANLLTALRAQLEKAREVKPLVWEDYPVVEGAVLSVAVTDFGTYFICDDNDDFSGLYCELITHQEATWYGTVKPKTHVIIDRVHEDDPASLKQEAQADYQRRYNAMSAQEGE